MVGHAHDDAEFVRQRRAFQSRTVVREDRRPHRRPHIVTLQAKQKLENVLVAFRVKSAETLVAPVSECGPFIVDEKSAETYRRLFGNKLVFSGDRYFRFSFRHDIQPVDKRRDPEHFRQCKKAVDRASLIRSRDHKRRFILRQKHFSFARFASFFLRHSLFRREIFDDLMKIYFALPADFRKVEKA